MADAEAEGDMDLAQRAEQEYDWLLAELEQATGLRGRDRGFADPGERARTSVKKALQRAVNMVRECDPVMATELESHLVTGYRCCYRRSSSLDESPLSGPHDASALRPTGDRRPP
jgi:hypothetical protein